MSKDWATLLPCDCCGYATIPAGSEYTICPICFWEDDELGDSDPETERGGPNHVSLMTARRSRRVARHNPVRLSPSAGTREERGGKDSVQEAEPLPAPPQPAPPQPAQPGAGPVASPRPGAQAQAYRICRNLHAGDPGYPGWNYCCDNDPMTQSYWTGVNGNRSGMWDGSCYSWGVR